ncbi:hypothetical protein [Streptomyces sp. NPDC003996]
MPRDLRRRLFERHREAVTGKPGTQNWYESVRVTCRSPKVEAARKAEAATLAAP